MIFEVVWTQFAQKVLSEIYQFYKMKVGANIAFKIRNRILQDSLILESNPNAFQKEFAFEQNGIGFHYLVSGHYKLIYFINENSHQVVIVHVFDSRRNPELMTKF